MTPAPRHSVLLLAALVACSEPAGPEPATQTPATQTPAPELANHEHRAKLSVAADAEAPAMATEYAKATRFRADAWNGPIGGGGGAGAMGGRRGRESSTESYAPVPESGFVTARAESLSTFGVDVDTASWSKTRRFLRDGKLPPADAVRIEEFVNAFSYGDPGPTGREAFGITTALGTCPWNTNHWLARIALRTRAIDAERVPPCNLVFLLDVSGSMKGRDKLPLLQRAFRLLTKQLRPQDHVAIVTYASGTRVPLESATGTDRQKIVEVIDDLKAGGSTAGAGGIQKAYEIAAAHRIPEGVNRVILATDGDFNVGISDTGELKSFIEARRDDGIFLSVLGFGRGNLKSDKLSALANHGNGAYAYIDTLAEARRMLVDQFGATLMTVAKDVKVQVEFNPKHVAGYRLLGYENRRMTAREFRDDKKDSGEIGAGHAVSALFEIVPAGQSVPGDDPKGEAAAAAAAPASYAGEEGELMTVRLRFKPPLGEKARETTRPVPAPANRPIDPSNDFAFASAVAAFAMRLRSSPHLANFDWEGILELAKAARGNRPERQEFVQLVERAQAIQTKAGNDVSPPSGGDR